MNLTEKYAKRLSICESIYKDKHNGQSMPQFKKVMIASVVENTKKFLNESFAANAATQGGAVGLNLGEWKKFCINLTSVALPNLIGTDLVITQPMSSMTGYITYLQYQAGIDKGGVKANDVFNTTFRMGEMTDDRINYTGKAVVESATGDGTTKSFDIMFTENAKLVAVKVDGVAVEIETGVDTPTAGKVALINNKVEFGTAPEAGKAVKIAYEYNNVIIPQETLPTLKANLKHLALTARARRIAIYYSQISAFQAKQDYGIDLAAQIAEQAVGELQYEIDSEIVKMLVDGAEEDSTLTWSRYLPVGVSKAQHYEGFLEVLEKGRAVMYKRTQKFSPNYMIIDAAILPIFTFVPGWKPSDVTIPNGPYFAGTINGMKVYVSPMINDGTFVMGVIGGDMQTSAGVYAPYMAVVPTQLLGFADGTMSQGFSTLYDMKLLSTYNGSIAEGTAVEPANGDDGQFSYLLVKGKVIDTKIGD